MTIAIGILTVGFIGLLYAGQVVSVANLGLAQRLGLQENPEEVDPLFTSLEVWTARWDLPTLWILPVAGVLMLMDHSWWPYVAMIGGGVAADTGGREIAKYLSLRQHGVRIGTPTGQRVLFWAMASVSLVGVVAAVFGLIEAV